ncbi:hypothetical protein EJ05DRAFT_521632 [Pseudovirgaria hyperparasitica]|uniref:Uncharacterized protein n=1 Tax=Pseudovirgaria hyperparasitica TaxID=470096 RepID=A0A6A6VVU7_9PEZI|nr:uncharacterized protein EJ05DRAFT_521632 [Pseudovirgaria hyperparasitica]KAF2753760.1 hypothetical protein EJ05DRAFT_521632 [Pseudovirgaria hyperparasitica]
MAIDNKLSKFQRLLCIGSADGFPGFYYSSLLFHFSHWSPLSSPVLRYTSVASKAFLMLKTTIDCTRRDSVERDGGVGGIGVLLSFMIMNAFCLALAFLITMFEPLCETRRKLDAIAIIMRKLLVAFSDQQIITGIGVLVISLTKMGSLDFYHFYMVYLIGCFATFCHMATTITLFRQYREDWLMKRIRQLLMGLNAMLSLVVAMFLLRFLFRKLVQTLPIACAWDKALGQEAISENPIWGKPILLIIIVIMCHMLLFGLGIYFLNIKEGKSTKLIQCFTLGVLSAACITIVVQIIEVGDAFPHEANADVYMTGKDENSWAYGQVLSMLLLWLPLMALVSIWREERVMAKKVEEDGVSLREVEREFGLRSITPCSFYH